MRTLKWLTGSVRTPLLGVALVLSVLALLPAISSMSVALREREAARVASQMNHAAARLSEGLFEILLERVLVNAALSAPAAIGAEGRAGIEGHRRVFGERIETTLRHLGEARTAEAARLAAELRAALPGL